MLLLGKRDSPTVATMGIGYIVGSLITAALLWWLGKRLNSAPGRELVDPKTGERLVLRRRHSLFWIPMQWWAIPYLVVAAFVLISFFTQKP